MRLERSTKDFVMGETEKRSRTSSRNASEAACGRLARAGLAKMGLGVCMMHRSPRCSALPKGACGFGCGFAS